MATLGKKVSSTVAVACIWLGGSGIFLLVYLVATAAVFKDEQSSLSRMPLVFLSPLVLALGGIMAVWLTRWSAGWPRLALPRLFFRTCCLAIVSWALIPVLKNDLHLVVLAAGILSLIGAMSLAWQKADKQSLGTHISPKSTLPPNSSEDVEDDEAS